MSDQPQPDSADQPAPVDGCAACAAEATGTRRLRALDPELHDGLTMWGTFGGAQIRLESEWLRNDDGQLIYPHGSDSNALPLVDPTEVTSLYIAFRDDAYRNENEDGKPWRIPEPDLRKLRDLLNIATARGVL